MTHCPSIRAAVGNFLAIMVIFNLRQRIAITASCDTRIPKVIERCDDTLEVAALGMFQARKTSWKGAAERAANDLRSAGSRSSELTQAVGSGGASIVSELPSTAGPGSSLLAMPWLTPASIEATTR